MNSLLFSRLWILVGLALLAAALGEAQPSTTMAPPVRGIHEMVGAANNFEVEAGYRILTQGGNAVDAGVASVLAASVTELSRFRLGDGVPVLIELAGHPPLAITVSRLAHAVLTLE